MKRQWEVEKERRGREREVEKIRVKKFEKKKIPNAINL